MTVDPKRVQSLFVKALELSSDEARVQLLDQECGKDWQLRERVEILLRAHDNPQGSLDEPSDTSIEATLDASIGERRGMLIADRYKLLEEIGEGGMGTVWVAEQTHPVRRKVALKLVKLGMDSRQVLARFEAERQALAMMDHPNIARVFDGGMSDRGRPFFVMEYVKGTPITEYCDHHRLSVSVRLQLFVQVCQAIQHAHQKGIIHRDLKPSNVLVCQYDGRPVPKVIDFGLAKAMHQPLTEHTLYTAHGLMVGTPLYMSPEQAESNNLDVDTRTDIYSLGVILYELLTGSTPIERQQFKDAAIQEIMRLIKETDPPKPSTRLSGSATVPSVAAQRSLDPTQLGRAIRGDLDWIVMKALEKDRSRRYETAIGLADDLERHLGHQPVVARPPSLGYRVTKLWQRNRGAILATSTIALALVAATAISFWQAARATKAYRLEQEARAVATAKQIEAERASDDAKRAQSQADQEARHAEVQRSSALNHLHAARMNMLQNAWERAKINRVRDLLEKTSQQAELDFEYYYWQTQLRLNRQTLWGHQERVDAVVYSPDGRRIFTAGGDYVVRVWDATNGRELQQLPGHTGVVFSMAILPDGKTLVTGSWDTTVRLWDTASGREISRVGHRASVRSVSVSEVGLLATADSDHAVILWEATDITRPPKEVWRIDKAGPSVNISHDGTRLITCGFNTPALKMWDTTERRELVDFEIDSNASRAMFSPNGERVLSSHVDQKVVMWSMTGTKLFSKKRHESGFVGGIGFSPDGKRFVTSGDDCTVRVWDTGTGRELQLLKGHSGWVRGVAFSPDGAQIASVSHDRTVKVWDSDPQRPADGRQPIAGHIAPMRCVALSPDGTRMVTAGEDQTAIIHRLPLDIDRLPLVGHKDWINAVALTGDGQRVVTASDDRTAVVWSAHTGRPLATFHDHQERVLAVAVSPDGESVVTGGWDGRGFVWDIESAELVQRLVGHTGPVWSVAFSPDGRYILTGSEDGSIMVWDASTGDQLSVLREHEGPVWCLAFCESEATGIRKFVSGSVDRKAHIWHGLPKPKLHKTLSGHGGSLTSVRYSHNGRRIVTASNDGTIRVWDAFDGPQLLSINAAGGRLLSADFGPDGHSLFASFADQFIKHWEVMSPQELAARQQEEREEVERAGIADIGVARLSPDFRPASLDGSIRQWLVLSPIRLSTKDTDNDSLRAEIKKKQISEEEISKGAEPLVPRRGKSILIGSRELRWRATQLVDDYTLRFDSLLGRGTSWPSCLGYAVAYVYSDTERDVQMRIGWDDYARVFLNGKLEFDSDGTAFAVDAITVPDIHLKAGRNTLLLKVVNDFGPWRAAVRFTDAAGNPVTDLSISSDPDKAGSSSSL